MPRKYPSHFYEPIRREIAVEQMKHDFRKLLPSLSGMEIAKVDRAIAGWFDGEEYELEPVHDFWNFFGGFARSLKLKSLLSWVTAENIIWQSEEVFLDEIIITWDFPGLEILGKAPHKASYVRKELNRPGREEHKRKMLEDADFRSARFPRDHFRIILFEDKKGGVIDNEPGLYVLEGNRRTVLAILKNKAKISAYVGRFKDPLDLWPQDYWFRTGVLRDLIFLAIGFRKEEDQKSFDLVRKFYQLLLQNFDIARIATIDKTFKNYERDEKLLMDIMLEDLK